MSEIVERMARAVRQAHATWEAGTGLSIWECLSIAAIAAMREPTEEMLAQADSAIPRAEADETGLRMMGREVALEAWRAMIDEAIRTKSGTGQAVREG